MQIEVESSQQTLKVNLAHIQSTVEAYTSAQSQHITDLHNKLQAIQTQYTQRDQVLLWLSARLYESIFGFSIYVCLSTF